MNLGKAITIFLSILIVILMIFMLANTPSQPTQQSTIEPNQNIKNDENNQNSEFEAEFNKIKELKQSISSNNDGVSKLYLQSCAPCHAQDGSGIIAPSIIKKSKEEILARLYDYKDGKIENSLMKGLLDNVSDENLTILAEEISKFK